MPVSDRQLKQKNKRSQKDVNHEEIQALLSKLKEIVPNMPRNRKLSKLEIIQYVIDYIVDLQIALESHQPNHHGINPRITSPSNRQPLGVIFSPSNSAANMAQTQEVNHAEKPTQTMRPDLVLQNISHSLPC